MLFFFFTLFLSDAEDWPAKNCMWICVATSAHRGTTSDTIYAMQHGHLYDTPASMDGVHESGAFGSCKDNKLCFPYSVEKPDHSNAIVLYTKGNDGLMIDYMKLTDDDGNNYEWGRDGWGAWCLSSQWDDHHSDNWQEYTNACYYALKLAWRSTGDPATRDLVWGYHGHNQWWGCNNHCHWPGDGECDDGGPNSKYSLCYPGSDCTDCGPRSSEVSVGGSPPEDVEYENMVQCRRENKEDCTKQESAWVQSILRPGETDNWNQLSGSQNNPGIANKMSKMSYSLAMKTPHTVNFFAFIGAGFVLFTVGNQCRSKTADFEEIPSEI